MHISPPFWTSLPLTSRPTLYVLTQPPAELPELDSSFPLVICLTDDGVYVSIHPELGSYLIPSFCSSPASNVSRCPEGKRTDLTLWLEGTLSAWALLILKCWHSWGKSLKFSLHFLCLIKWLCRWLKPFILRNDIRLIFHFNSLVTSLIF